MKSFNFVWCTIASILAILSCAQQSFGLSHDSTVGYCSNIQRNRTLPAVSKIIHKPNNKIFRSFRKTEITIRFPEFGDLSVPISCITMKDNATDGTGGLAMIKEGGINFRYTTIKFISQRGSDIRFAVDVYAEPFIQPMYPSNQVPPAGWAYPQPGYQQQYAFNRN